MIKKIIAGLALVILAVVYSTTVAPAASASGDQGSAGVVIDSAYSTPEQSLSLVLNHTAPTCTETEVWEYWVTVQNNSDLILEASIHEGRKGGAIEPGHTAQIQREAVAATDSVTLLYSFGDNPVEEFSFTVAAPDCVPVVGGPDVEAIDCTLGNFTPQEKLQEDGGYIVGDELNFVLTINGGLPSDVTAHIVVTGTDMVYSEEFQLDDLNFTYVPKSVGNFLIEGYFTNQDGGAVAVKDQVMCSATLFVSADVDAPPTPQPTVPEPPKAPTVQPVKASPQPAVATLPRTGSGTTVLTIVGFGLLSVGVVLNRRFAAR